MMKCDILSLDSPIKGKKKGINQKRRKIVIALIERKTVMLLRNAVMEEAGPRTLEIILADQRYRNKFALMEFPLCNVCSSFPLDCHLLGKSSPKSMKGTGPSPHAYPKVIRIQEITGTRLKL